MIDAIDGSFVSEPPIDNYLILDNFDEHFLDEPKEYGIIGYEIKGEFHKIYFKNKNRMIKFLKEENHRNDHFPDDLP